MARKGQVSIQEVIETNEEFETFLENNYNRLIFRSRSKIPISSKPAVRNFVPIYFSILFIGLEVYSEFCGYCLATAFAVRKGKLEIGEDRIAMARAAADQIDALSRFKDRSEPVFLFISKGKLTKAMFGANGVELCRLITEELGLTQKELDSGVERPKHDIQELLPEEAEKIEEDMRMEEEMRVEREKVRVQTVAARKRRIADRMTWHVRRLNFILFWPHCHQAHYDLYEKWDLLNLQVAAKETIQMTEEGIKEALYMSDVDPNEACLHALMNGEALVVLFKMLDTDDRNFVKLMRYTLYEEIPVPKEDQPPEKQLPPIPAYERYATISKSTREVRRERHNLKMQKLLQEKEERERLAAEKARLAREEEEDRLRLEKQRQEEERMARIQAGLPADLEPEPRAGEEEIEEEETKVPEEVAEEETTEPDTDSLKKIEEELEKEFHSEISIEGEEYIPPEGLLVPGLYSPPNNLAKSNGLAYFFPKVVSQITPIESEYLPPHALVMFSVDKRHDVKEIIDQCPNDILNYGIFVGDDPSSAEHVAYTIKQYDKMQRLRKHKDRLAVMVSRKKSLPLLQLAGLHPCYISHDEVVGERDCLTLFPVGYGDDYMEEESVKEEEIQEAVTEISSNSEEVVIEEKEKVSDEEEEEED